jgi:ABC-type dipeptide/oligopeptide/nickel transport system permease subunit
VAWALRTLKHFANRQPLGTVGLVIIITLIVVAIFAPLLAPADPLKPNGRGIFADWGSGEGGLFILGGDQLGRDVLSRLIYGARISLVVSLAATTIGITVGTMIGIISAVSGGRVDMILQRIVDSLMAFPSFILALAIIATMGSTLTNVVIAISITIIAPTARALRAQAMGIVPMDYVTAATAIGSGYWRILFRHVLPNCLSLTIILFSITLGAAIIIESSLSFLGLGASPEEPTWGGMMSAQTYRYLRVSPSLVWLPALAIGLVVFAFNMLGDALRDVWDPRLRGSR